MTIMAGAGAVAASHARTLNTLGVQLYTLRGVITADPLATLRAVEQIGYREAELVVDNLDKVMAAIKQTQIKPVSLHMDSTMFQKRQAELPAALADAKKRGFEYAVCPYIAPADRGGSDMMKRLGDTLNKAGAICKELDLKLCYHNHAFEWEPFGGGILLDVLLDSSDPKLVNLELDIMWAKVGGFDPAAVITKYAKRIELLHLKNVADGIEKRFNEQVPRTAFKEVGNGVIDIPSVLAASAAAGVKHYFVEQDQTTGDPLASLKESFQYVQKLNF